MPQYKPANWAQMRVCVSSGIYESAYRLQQLAKEVTCLCGDDRGDKTQMLNIRGSLRADFDEDLNSLVYYV